MDESKAVDVPMGQLRPLRDRTVGKQEYNRILASIKAIGLIEPLIVYPEGDAYLILDGVQRYRALAELGAEVAPCIVGKYREAFTGNRMVNRISPVQEHRMIEKSLEELDEQSIASALGVLSITHRVKRKLLKQLHLAAATAFDQGKITKACARELTHVEAERQQEIVTAMDGYKDYSIAFARAMILKTPRPLRETRGHKKSPWDKNGQRKDGLIQKLAEAEHRHDFYSRLYKQYTIDLLRLAIYARSLLTNARVREYLDQSHPSVVSRFEAVIADAKA